MKIHTLTIKNFRCFQGFYTKFEDELTIFVAKNGQGKSSILDAIRIALWPYISGFDYGYQTSQTTGIDVADVYQKKISDFENKPKLPASIRAEITLFDTDIKSCRYRERMSKRTKTKECSKVSKLKKSAMSVQKEIFAGDENIILPVLAYYGTGRLWNMKKVTHPEKKIPSRTYGYRGCLDPASTFKYFAEWFTSIYKEYRDAQIIALEKEFDNKKNIEKRLMPIKVIQRSINCILENQTGWKDLRYDTQSKSLCLTNDQHGILSVDQLSDGIRNLFGVVADIAYRCFLLNPVLGIDAAKETSGIVLIDEIDMHLHPAWQQTILGDLHEAFPKIQFIVTTHSPQVLSSVKPEQIRLLQDDNVVPLNNSTYGAESSRILEEIFGVSSRPRDNEAKILLDKYFQMIHDNQFDSEEAKACREKLDSWLYGDSALDKADMLIRRAERQREREVSRA